MKQSPATATAGSELAISGGPKLRTTAYPTWPYFPPEDIEAAAAVLRSGKINYWTGDEGRQFEREYAQAVGRKHAIAVANGSLALELALYVLDIGPGDEVVTSSRTFIASASCAVMRGAIPVVAEVDRESGNVTAETLRRTITPRTKAFVVVHLAGWPAEMDAIMALARERGIKVVEDCAQANGATVNGKPVGSFGDVAAFSFCQDKIITTGGEGGMVLLDEEEQWKRAWAFKDHGKCYDAVYHREHAPGFRWVHESFGTNWRLTEFQSVLGRRQLQRLPQMVERRRRSAAMFDAAFAELPALRIVAPAGNVRHSYYKYYAYLCAERLREGWTRDRIAESIQAEGIPCFSGSCSEIYLEKAFPQEWRPVERFPVARELGETSLMWLVHPTLDDQDIADAIAATKKVLAEATR